MKRLLVLTAVVLGLSLTAARAADEPTDILNISYDISRELYEQIDKAFSAAYKNEKGKNITVNQSYAGSSKQARSILEGLEADVVTFNQVTDVQILHDKGDFIPRRLAIAPVEQFVTLLLAAGFSGTRRKPQEHQKLGRSSA